MLFRRSLGLSMIWVIIAVMSLSNIWRLDTLPYTDLPNHLAEAYIYNIGDEPDHPMHEHYSIRLQPYTPNSLHIMFCSLFPDIEFGNRVFYSLAVLILLAGMAVLVHMARGEAWLAVLAAVLTYHYSMVWGFTGSTMGVSLLLLIAVVLCLWMKKPSITQTLILAAALILIYACHAFMFLVAVAIVACTIMLRFTLPWRTRIRGLLALAPAMTLFSVWAGGYRGLTEGEPLWSSLSRYYLEAYFPTLARRLARFGANENFRLAEGFDGVFIALIFTMPIILFFMIGFWSRRRDLRELSDDPVRHVALVFSAVTILCYLFAPEALSGEPMLYQRLSVSALLGIIWLTSFFLVGRLRLGLMILTVPLVLAHGILWHQYFQRISQGTNALTAVLEDAPGDPHEAVTAIIVVPRLERTGYKKELETIHYLNYRLIRQGGLVTSRSTEYRFRVLNRLDAWLPAYHDMVGDTSDRREIVASYEAIRHIITNDAECVELLLMKGYEIVSTRSVYKLLSRPFP